MVNYYSRARGAEPASKKIQKVGFFYKSHFLAKVCPETSKDVQKWDFSINPTFWQKYARRRPKVGFFYKSHFLAKVCPEASKSWVFL